LHTTGALTNKLVPGLVQLLRQRTLLLKAERQAKAGC